MAPKVEKRASAATQVKSSWIAAELKQLYGAKQWKAGKGVDLNGDGTLQRNEKIATFNKNKIPGNDKKIIGDCIDWVAFYRANARVIQARAGRNQKSIFHWAAKFKTTNPLHIITSIESRAVTRAKVLTAYKKVWKIIARARKITVKGKMKLDRAKSKITAVYKAILKSGIKIRSAHSNPLFIDNLDGGVLDCDTSSFVMLTEAHEQGWPLFLVISPLHAFVRWDDKVLGVRFNWDNVNYVSTKRFVKDSEYTKFLGIPRSVIAAGVYLKTLGLSDLVAQVFLNRGAHYLFAKDYWASIRDNAKAVKLSPKAVGAYNNRAYSYRLVGKRRESARDSTRAIKLDSHIYSSYENRGITYEQMAKRAMKTKDYARAIKMYTNAIPDYRFLQKALQKSLKNPILRAILMGMIQPLPKKGFYRDKVEMLHMKRGIAHIKTKEYAKGIRDFKTVLKMHPKNSLAKYLLKKYAPCVRNPRKCKS